MARSVKQLTLDFGSGHDLTVCATEPRVGLCADSAEPAWDSLCSSPTCALSLSLSQNKINFNKNYFKLLKKGQGKAHLELRMAACVLQTQVSCLGAGLAPGPLLPFCAWGR